MFKPAALVPAPLASYRAHRAQIQRAIRRVLERGRYILGPEVAAFEREWARAVGVRAAVGVASGTEALWLALRAAGIGPGDLVVTVSHTAVATVAAIELAGATPLLVDIDPATYTMDPQRVAETVRGLRRGRPKALVPVHLYGQPADLPALAATARRHGLVLIEDCAQAHGAAVGGRPVGRWGELAAFSFYPTKNLGAFGDGGAVVTRQAALADRVRQLREYGWRTGGISHRPGMNSRLDELQAAILRVKLRHLDRDNARRRMLARCYDEALPPQGITRPACRPGVTPVYHQYVVRASRRDRLRAFLAARGIPTQIHYPVPVHQQPAYRRRLAVGRGGLRQTELVCRTILSLPIHPSLTVAQVRAVAAGVAEWAAREGSR